MPHAKSFTALLIAIAASAGCDRLRLVNVPPKFDTPYQAVLLDNGQLYFGRLERLETQFPVLRDVYYVQATINPETKQQSNILRRRGKEWHGPDQMVINAQHILLIEPVSTQSKVAQLIAENQK
jgi:hypothetical protein